jgi:hypothetical protein
VAALFFGVTALSFILIALSFGLTAFSFILIAASQGEGAWGAAVMGLSPKKFGFSPALGPLTRRLLRAG